MGQNIVTDIMVRYTDPFGPAGAKRFSVHKERGLASKVQLHGNRFVGRRFRQGDVGAAPHIFPSVPPGRSFLHRAKRSLRGLAGRKMPYGGKTVKLDAFKRTVKIAGQDTLPMGQPIPVFGMNQFHRLNMMSRHIIIEQIPTLESGFLI